MYLDRFVCVVLVSSALSEPILADDKSTATRDQAPSFATPLHEQEALRDEASGAKSPPMFLQSFEPTEEVLPFELSLEEAGGQVVIKPVTDKIEPEVKEEIREELLELEIKAELKWQKS